jgi:hypothetical protein
MLLNCWHGSAGGLDRLDWKEEKFMSDGREEREELEKRREQEKRENFEDRIDRGDVDEWEPERVDS